MTNNASSMLQALVQLSAPGSKLGGLSYSIVSASNSGGVAVLVYADTAPPTVSSAGTATGSAGTLVLDPDEWTGTKLVPITALKVVMKRACSTLPRRSSSGAAGRRCPAGRSRRTRPTSPHRAGSTTGGPTRARNRARAPEQVLAASRGGEQSLSGWPFVLLASGRASGPGKAVPNNDRRMLGVKTQWRHPTPPGLPWRDITSARSPEPEPNYVVGAECIDFVEAISAYRGTDEPAGQLGGLGDELPCRAGSPPQAGQ